MYKETLVELRRRPTWHINGQLSDKHPTKSTKECLAGQLHAAGMIKYCNCKAVLMLQMDTEASQSGSTYQVYEPDLSWPWYWESVKLEGVCTVPVRRLLFQILWQVDDHDSIERAFL